MREELSTRLNSNETMEIIRDKEEQIRGLLEEGEDAPPTPPHPTPPHRSTLSP